MTFREIKVVPRGDIAKGLDEGRRVTRQELTRFVTRYVVRGTANIQEKTPVGFSGALRGGYAYEVQGAQSSRPRGIITNPALYHDVREEGRKPGRQPPVEALIPWVGSKLGIPAGPERRSVAFLVARKIGSSGYEGAHMVKRGMEKTRRQMKPEATKLGLKIIRASGPK